jgi:hypothetical protein
MRPRSASPRNLAISAVSGEASSTTMPDQKILEAKTIL